MHGLGCSVPTGRTSRSTSVLMDQHRNKLLFLEAAVTSQYFLTLWTSCTCGISGRWSVHLLVAVLPHATETE